MEIKTTNALMKYLRDRKGIDIQGSEQKNMLLNIGYYHAYKGCRFFKEKKNRFNFTTFSQVETVYNFDSKLKAIIYPHIMFIETALKNRTLQNIVEYGRSDKIVDLFDICFNAHNDYGHNTVEHKALLNKSVRLKAKIYDNLSRKNNESIIAHFTYNDRPVPIWALFEILTLGDFCSLYGCLNKDLRKGLSKELGIEESLDTDTKILFDIIKTLKDLRNSVAHNQFVYDNRFNKYAVPFRLGKYLQSQLGIPNIRFKSICDYIILISYLLKQFKVTKTEIKRFIREFREACNILYQNIGSLSIYNKILPTDTMNKLTILEKNI